MSTYWQDRMAASLTKVSSKRIKEIEKQLKKYYAHTMNSVINDFESTYDKLMASAAEGKEVTLADLYKMDRYWQMQGQVKRALQELGDKKISLFSKIFEINFFDVYYSINIEGATAFTTIDKSAAQHIINQIWCADGKSWSQRIWEDTTKLQEVLNEKLVDCILTGKKPTELKKQLQEQFGVSYRRADTVVRTEIAHIQTQAAQQRYKDYGIEEVEIWADEDERRCDVCGKLHRTKYKVGAFIPIPAHPNCRCCIVPVIKK